MKTYMYNTILVHTARTWERIRLEQPHEEMPFDNIESVEEIMEIANDILQDKVIQKFINMGEEERSKTWNWDGESEHPCSDIYIEHIAEELIYNCIK